MPETALQANGRLSSQHYPQWAPQLRPRPRLYPLQAKRNEVSESYAKALVELAEEKGKLEPVHADVDAIASLLQNNKKLTDLLFNPVVDPEKKRAVLQKIGKEAGFNQYTNNFLNLLVQKDRLPLLEEICQEFEDLYCKLTDTQVRARSHGPLSMKGQQDSSAAPADGSIGIGVVSTQHIQGPWAQQRVGVGV